MGAAGYTMPASFPFVRLSVTKIHLIHKLNLLNAASIIFMWISVLMMGAPPKYYAIMYGSHFHERSNPISPQDITVHS